MRLPETVDAGVRLGDGDAVDLDFDLAGAREDVHPVVGVLGMVEDGGEFFIPLVWGLLVDGVGRLRGEKSVERGVKRACGKIGVETI